MKKILTLALAFSCGAALAQKTDNVGIGTTKPDPSAILDLNSNTKGLLLPRMNQAQRDAIKNPAAGLVIFQTDQVVGTYTFDGTAWQPSNARTSAVSSVGAWDKQGNAIDGTDFLGSTNNFPLVFKVNGIKAGYIDNTDYDNVFIGRFSGQSTVTSGAPVATNSGGYNLGIGSKTLQANTTGASNTAIGAAALFSNTIGYSNLGLGGFALFQNVSGNTNTAIGLYSMFANQSGSGNIAIGSSSLEKNISGGNNVAIGSGAGFNNTAGNNNVFIGFQGGYSETGSNKLYISNSSAVNPLIKGDFNSNWVKVNSKTAGYLAVGDFDAGTPMPTPAGYRLIVQDGILTEKLKVALRTDGMNWADYVFEPSYKLMPLEEVEKYTTINKHLPNVPSADEITKEGIDVAKVSKMFMEKIEELTLYIIELNKEIKVLKEQQKGLNK
ncbi:hypothetical protein [Runella salmonicolor]|uniref:Peptidase S74 domain-containing protein n=1 Tax=Runella salmonicolor TaxID=2950278 RepID=A0ABT1FUM6_9BACT|nr:hypothetical protein [Runella salmonicolor]MCP1384363.1 hypothetical protein [Runella salmonicolor]